MEPVQQYGHAFVSLAGIVLLWVVMNPLSAVKKAGKGVPSGGAPVADYADPAYRWYRAYMNLTEILAPFAVAVLAAILTGANPFWVNVLASLFLLSRIAVAVVHVRGIGKADGGTRSILFAIGWAICGALAIMTVVAVFR